MVQIQEGKLAYLQERADRADGMIAAIADLADRLGDKLKKASLTKKARLAIVAEMQAIRVEFIGPRP
jgi:hypothetical protein